MLVEFEEMLFVADEFCHSVLEDEVIELFIVFAPLANLNEGGGTDSWEMMKSY